MKVLRLTRHWATSAQKAALEAAFPGCEVERISENLPSDSREAVARFDQLTKGFQVAEVVLPVNLLEAILKYSQFCRNGGIIIRAVMDREMDEGGNATFTFSHYEKILEIKIVTKKL